MDGVHLSQFVVGRTYEVGASVGSFLVSVGAAELDESTTGEDHLEQPVLARRRPHGDRTKK
jgi:hypothetical protein